jgi:hypothetical protein
MRAADRGVERLVIGNPSIARRRHWHDTGERA